jgi:hypothetical protein
MAEVHFEVSVTTLNKWIKKNPSQYAFSQKLSGWGESSSKRKAAQTAGSAKEKKAQVAGLDRSNCPPTK